MAIITNLLDNDFYKYTMCQAVLHKFPGNMVEYEFINRSNINLGHLKEEIDNEISNYCNLTFNDDELEYLKTIPFLKEDFIDMLSFYSPKRSHIKTFLTEDNDLGLKIRGPWWQTILYEVPLLAIIEEVYMKSLYSTGVPLQDLDIQDKLFADGESTLSDGLKNIIDHLYLNIKFADFGTRRRFSKRWHKEVIRLLLEHFPSRLVGTSNVFFAKYFGIKPIGTMAHEWFMGQQSLYRLVDHQKMALENWVHEYRGDLGIALTDTIGIDAFLNDFDKYFAKLYDGLRHDSGCPYKFTDKVVAHYEKLGIDTMTKTIVYSDGLDFKTMVKLAEYAKSKNIKYSFGIGTNLMNNIPGYKPLSIVIKLTDSNGKPVAKISDEPVKAICHDKEYLNYLKSQFNIEHENI